MGEGDAGTATAELPTIRVGTSGWHYGHWRGVFYPPRLPAHAYLRHYASHFNAVEINNSFYRLPKKETFAAWREQVPAGFVFACKASRFITHYSKLQRTSKTYALFFDTVAALEEKLGPILFQLPPAWKVNAARLDDFLAHLPAGLPCAFEFRNETWFCDEVYDVLRRHGAAFCIYDLQQRVAPFVVTSGLVYVRLHGPVGAYGGSYDDATLDDWAARFREWQGQGRAVHCYFDNDEKAYAVRDALRLRERLLR